MPGLPEEGPTLTRPESQRFLICATLANNGTLRASTTKMMPVADVPAPASRDSTPASFSRWLLPLLLGLGGMIYAAFIGTHVGAYPSGSDSSGYLNSARLLRAGHISAPERVLPTLPVDQTPVYAYVPLGFIPAQPGRIVPTYAIGVPLLVNATAVFTGARTAANWTLWWHAVAGVGLMFVLGRLAGLASGWAALGALLMASCPLHIFFSLQMMSDVPATTWATATVVFAWLSRRDARWALLAGFSLGIAVLIRPTNLLLILPAAIALGPAPRRWLAFVVAGLPAAAGLFYYNGSAYGNPFASGYGNIGDLFAWANVAPGLAHYGKWLPVLLTPLGVLALGLPLCARRLPLWTAVLIAWLVGFFTIYAAYFHTHETWWYLRFVLPAFPAAWVAALLVMREILQRTGWDEKFAAGSTRAWIAGLLLAAAILGFSMRWNRHFGTAAAGRNQSAEQEAIAWMQQKIPANAVLAAMQASGALFYFTDFPIVRWDQLEERDFPNLARATAAAGRPLFALLEPFEEERVFVEKRLTGRWTKIGVFQQIGLWKFEPGAP